MTNPSKPWSRRLPHGLPGPRGWDTIVLGSGMGGMTCAALLARLGQRVLVLEHHYVPGGFTQTFTRKGWTWDVGVHAVGEVDERALLGKVLLDLTGQRLRWASLGPVYDTFEFPDFRIDFSSDRKSFQAALQAAFPGERDAIAEYARVTREVGGAMRAYYLSRLCGAWAAPLTDRLLAAPALRLAVKFGGIAYLVWMAWRLAAVRTLGEVNAEQLDVGFWQGVGLQFLNIKAWMLALALAAGWVTSAGSQPAANPGERLAIVCAVMPPVGQIQSSPKGPSRARSALVPPAASAGKNLKCRRPRSSPRMISLAVATPGKKGISAAMAARARPSVRPGDTMKSAPAASAASSPAASITVPAPTIAPSTAFISRMTSSATWVRSVTSMTARPPATNASATTCARARSSMTSTGMSGLRRMSDSIGFIARTPAHRLLRRQTVRARGA